MVKKYYILAHISMHNIHTVSEPVLTGNVREWDILGSKHSSGRRQRGRPMGHLGSVDVDTSDTWVWIMNCKT